MSTAITAARLRATLGVNTHMGWQDTATWSQANQPKVEAALAYSGITFFRDGAPVEWNGTLGIIGRKGVPDKPGLYDGLFRRLGLRLNVLVSAPDGSGDMMANLREFAKQTPGALCSIEGENETQRAPALARADLQKLHQTVKADAALGHLPVIACSTTGVNTIETIGDVRGIADYSNDHPYSGTASPGHAMSSSAARMAATSPALPKMDTEFGWSLTAPGSWSMVSDADRARFTLIGWMTAAACGVERAYLYALMDNGAATSPNNEDTFGLFAQDGTPHAAATAVHNMMAILADTGASAPSQAGPVAVTESAPNTLVVTKDDGSQWLIFWPVNDGPAAPALVTLPAPVASLTLYDPIQGVAPVWTAPAPTATVQLTVPTHPIVLAVGKTLAPGATGNSPPVPPKPTVAASPSGTVVTAPGAPIITDNGGHMFTLVATPTRGYQIARDNVVDATTAQVRLLAWIGGTLYQVNGDGHGWSMGVAGDWQRVQSLPMAA